MLCHTFPQERPTGRSGTASAGSDKSADAEVPSFFRKSYVASAVFSPPVRGRFYQPAEPLSMRHRGCQAAVKEVLRSLRHDPDGPPIAFSRTAILFDWRAEKCVAVASKIAVTRRHMAISET